MSVHSFRPSSKVTDLRTRTGYQPNFATLARHRISAARSAVEMSPAEFAAMLTPLIGRVITADHVVMWEGEVTPPGDVLIAAMAVSPSSATSLGVRSHKFVTAFPGPAAVDRLGIGTTDVDYDGVQCELHTWEFGSAIFHLVEDLELPDITSMALWRIQSYEENLDWATRFLRDQLGDAQTKAAYVLSVYWVHSPIWVGATLDAGLRIMCAPRVLLDRNLSGNMEATQINAERVEQELLAEGFQPSEMRSIGVQGISAGFASWSGVVYHPFDADRALAEEDIVALELDLQSVWAFCEYVNSTAEHGGELVSDPRRGCTVLRAARARLMAPQPQETGQHRTMRDAIVETSGLPAHLGMALDTLKEARQ